MNSKLIKGLLASAVLGFAAQASAYEVTIYDGVGTGGGSAQEIGEVEPGALNTYAWDLQRVDINDGVFSMSGGFDFINGVAPYTADNPDGEDFTSGDIFLAVGEAPVYGTETGIFNYDDVSNSVFGYDYVLDMDYTNGTYSLVSLNDESVLTSAYYSWSTASSPWKYSSGGEVLEEGLTFSVSEESGEYTLSVDLAYLFNQFESGTQFWSHFTQGCGNDNLMGSWEVPEPTTIALLSMGLFGLWFSRRKQVAGFKA